MSWLCFKLAKIAKLVGLNTLLRTTIESTGIASSCLYDGAAGVAHLHHKLYQISGQEAYRRSHLFWLNQTQRWLHLELASDAYPPCADGLLHGLVGAGLVLLSAMTKTKLDWNAILL